MYQIFGEKLGVPAHGILSFDLKEDKNGEMKVTEINIRHMAYAGVMAHVGFDRLRIQSESWKMETAIMW